MCGILGHLSKTPVNMHSYLVKTAEKGRDSWGAWLQNASLSGVSSFPGEDYANSSVRIGAVTSLLFNARAVPTTEYDAGQKHSDIQPYEEGGWVVVHNGTISNNEELIKSFKLQPQTRVDSWVIAGLLDELSSQGGPRNYDDELEVFINMVSYLEGSYAIIAKSPSFNEQEKRLFFATDYRPLYITYGTDGITVSSTKLEDELSVLVKPYSVGYFTSQEVFYLDEPEVQKTKPKTLVVHSGGLDSTVVAAMLKDRGHDITLLHFDYGCRATKNEITAVQEISAVMQVPHEIVKLDVFKEVIKHSRLLDENADIASGIAGAETAHEWVPARNLILTSIVLGIAEARGFDHIALGINLEESGGGYTDNVIDLYEGLNGLMQWVVGRGRKLSILTPVGNMMKHDIVRNGLLVKAPMDKSWSCYNASETQKHCGDCGPCFMRRKAFQMNGAKDPVFNCEEV